MKVNYCQQQQFVFSVPHFFTLFLKKKKMTLNGCIYALVALIALVAIFVRLPSPRKFIDTWLKRRVDELFGKKLIHLSGPVGVCKSTLAKLIAMIHYVPVVLVDELGKNQKFYLIQLNGEKQNVCADTELPKTFFVVVANCGTNPQNRPNEKNGTFPAAQTQKLGGNGAIVAEHIKTAIEENSFVKVEMWKLLDALADRFGKEKACRIWTEMVFSRTGNSYVDWKTEKGPLTPSQQTLALFADWGKGFQPWSKTVIRLTAPTVIVKSIKEEKKSFVIGYLSGGSYTIGEAPKGVELNQWYGKQQLPIQRDGTVETGRNVPHVTLGSKLPFAETLTFCYEVVLKDTRGNIIGSAKYAKSNGYWYHMTQIANGIPPVTLGQPFVKNALDKFVESLSGGGGKAD